MVNKFLISIGIILLILIGVRIFFGTLTIEMGIRFKNPSYGVRINDELIMSGIESKKTITIVPFLAELKLYQVILTEGTPSYRGVLDEGLKIDIIFYECYIRINDKEKKVGCSNKNKYKKMIDFDNNNYIMKILGGTKSGFSNELLYDGKFISDLSVVIKEPGNYTVILYSNYHDIDNKVQFTLRIK